LLCSIREETSSETKSEGTGSVNKPEARPSSNQVASPGEEAGPSNRTLPVENYPYQPNEVIGGDSVLSIQQRFLDKSPNSIPSAEEIYLARIDAEDLFGAKVEIIRTMAVLDPKGDWMASGARALYNPRTATGEDSLERLFSLRDDLNRNGENSQSFAQLKSKMLKQKQCDETDRGSAS